jgi:internalin A
MSMRTAESEIELENRLRTGRLKLNDLQLNELPDQLFDLHHLTTLHLGENNLTHLDERLAALRDLKTLYLNGNKFEIFPPVVAKLVALEELDVSRNRISSLPPELTKLSELVYLHVSGNPLAGNIADVEKLPKLRNLVAAQIGATEFPLPVTEVTKLQTLNLTDNSFATIPPEFAKLTNLANLYLTADRLSSPPPEIIARGPHAIINYLRAFDKKGPSFVLREAKLLIVGEGAVGKTCLMNRLISDKFEEHSVTTEGIDINAWEVPDNDGKSFRVNVWDFGGQEIYHSTHQFFLTKRSLYLFLWEARKEENIHSFDYWLSVVSLLGKQAPVLIVMNKADERIKTIDEESLQKKFRI